MTSAHIIYAYLRWHYSYALTRISSLWYQQVWLQTYACGMPDVIYHLWQVPRFVPHTTAAPLREIIRLIGILARLILAALWLVIISAISLLTLFVLGIWLVIPFVLVGVIGIGISIMIHAL